MNPEFYEEGSNRKYKIASGPDEENISPDRVSQECLAIVVQESETIPMADRKGDREILPGENIEEGTVEVEVNKKEAQTNGADDVVVEALIASNEIIVVEDKVVAQDDVLPEDGVLPENDVLPEDDVLQEDEVLSEDDIADEVLTDDEVLFPDAITPSIMLIVFNVILPTIDIFLDTALVKKLFLNEYWFAGLIVTSGILTNFLFTSLAWWRLESSQQKKWSWIFLLFQLWPQLKAFQVEDESKNRCFI